MRIAPADIATIKRLAAEHFGPQAAIYVFGSRADDGARGGDIDLFIDLPQPLGDELQRELALYADLIRALGEQKIDIVIATPLKGSRPIFDHARATGVRL